MVFGNLSTASKKCWYRRCYTVVTGAFFFNLFQAFTSNPEEVLEPVVMLNSNLLGISIAGKEFGQNGQASFSSSTFSLFSILLSFLLFSKCSFLEEVNISSRRRFHGKESSESCQ